MPMQLALFITITGDHQRHNPALVLLFCLENALKYLSISSMTYICTQVNGKLYPEVVDKHLNHLIINPHSKKREPSYLDSGNVNWCSHYGKQYGGASQN